MGIEIAVLEPLDDLGHQRRRLVRVWRLVDQASKWRSRIWIAGHHGHVIHRLPATGHGRPALVLPIRRLLAADD